MPDLTQRSALTSFEGTALRASDPGYDEARACSTPWSTGDRR